jgi:H+/Cl- antiporter ClcA
MEFLIFIHLVKFCSQFFLIFLGIFFVVYFILLVMTSGLALASGLFVPMMLLGTTKFPRNFLKFLGGTFGRIIGQSVQLVFPGNALLCCYL